MEQNKVGLIEKPSVLLGQRPTAKEILPCKSQKKARKESTGPLKIQNTSGKGDNNLPSSTFSHTELHCSQNICGCEYTISSKKVHEMVTTMPILCPICPAPFPVESDWSEEDWVGKIQKKKREKQRKEEEMRQRQEEKREILDSSYYQPEPMYVSNYKEQTPTLVHNLVLVPVDSRDTQQDKSNIQTEQDRRVIM